MPERAQQHGLHVRTVLAVLGALALVVLLVGAAVHAFAKWRETPLAGANRPLDAQIAEPKLESAPQYDRAQFFAEKQQLIESYGWVDRKQGVARIPIEVAAKILAQRYAARGGSGPVSNPKGSGRAVERAGAEQ